MEFKKTAAIICPLLAAVSAVLIVLSVINFTKEADVEIQINEKAAEFVMDAQTVTDALAKNLGAVISNDMKAQQTYPEGIREELRQAYSINNNLVGWLTIPGTEMDTAVLQSDDNSYYLKRDFYERYTTETVSTNYGNIYLDYRCITEGISKNTVIHGHTTGKSDGIPKQSFRSLYDYRDKNHFIENPIIRYSTLFEEYTFKICAVFLSTAQAKDDNGYLFNYIYPDMSDENMVGYIEQVRQRMLYETGVSLEPTDKVITLSTCIYDYGKSVDTRLVVVGRLLRDGESESIDPTLVKDNPDYRRPQVWYNRNGKTNPYKNSTDWQPKA